MLIQQVSTTVPPHEVIRRARDFFTTRFSPYAGFVDQEGETFIRFRFEAGSLSIGAGTRDSETWVRGSSTRLHHEVSQFFTTLSVPENVRQNVIGPGTAGAG